DRRRRYLCRGARGGPGSATCLAGCAAPGQRRGRARLPRARGADRDAGRRSDQCGRGAITGLTPPAKYPISRMEPESRITNMEQVLLDRITANPEIFGGKPIIRGLRISVELILSLLAQGEPVEAVLDDYPELEIEDIRACLAYAHAVVANDRLEAVKVS